MQRRNVAILAFVVVVVAVCAVAVYSLDDDGQGDYTQYFPDPITDEMRDRPSADEITSSLDVLLDDYIAVAVAEGSSQDDIAEALRSYYEQYSWYLVQQSVLVWDYYTDPATYGKEYVAWQSALTSASSDFDDALRESLDGPNSDSARHVIDTMLGEGTSARLESSESTTQEELDLLQRESELAAAYNLAETPEEMADIFLELIDVRNSLAALWGYDTYADYAYEVTYGRDYSPDDSDALLSYVRDYAVPLVQAMSESGYTVQYDYDGTDQLYADASPFIHSISEGFGDLYDYMLENELIDFEDVGTKVDAGFTNTMVTGWNKVVFIYCKPYNNSSDLTTLIHEFGHSAASGLNSAPLNDYDISEIQSQGLEALFAVSPLNPIEGDADASFISSMLSAIILGCVHDEFQQRAYASDADSLEDLDMIYEGILAELGVSTTQHWYSVYHTFALPFYYISYAVSAFNALEIFVDALDDYDAAVAEYLQVNQYQEEGYIGMTEALGMMSAFDAGDFAQIMDALYEHLFGQTADVPTYVAAAAEA